MPTRSACRVATGLVALGLAIAAPAQTATDIRVEDYHKLCTRELAEAGQRHLELGSWARDRGLVPQATAQFLRAEVVSKGKHPGVANVLMYMRGLGDAFWTKKRTRPGKLLLAEFERKSRDIETKTRKAHAMLAQRAARAQLADAAKDHWLEVLRLGGELDVDPKGLWRLDGERVPDELADWLQQQTRTIAGKPVYDAAGKAAPALPDAIEEKSDRLLVHTDLPSARCRDLHALGTALWPQLQDRLDGAPTRPLRLFVFGQRADYDAYLQARGLGLHRAGRGLCDYGAFQTLVCAEGLADAELHGLVLHELSHLFFFGSAPAVMPDWYAEGFAESVGGQGTFTWDGKTLTLGGSMQKERIAAVQAQPLSLRELLDADAAQLLAADHDKGLRFYAQSWALQRFLRLPDCPWNARFLHFEQKCRGQALGAPPLGAANGLPVASTFGNPAAARTAWDQLFAPDHAALEAAFATWLAGL